jgi:hypothetical protein
MRPLSPVIYVKTSVVDNIGTRYLAEEERVWGLKMPSAYCYNRSQIQKKLTLLSATCVMGHLNFAVEFSIMLRVVSVVPKSGR